MGQEVSASAVLVVSLVQPALDSLSEHGEHLGSLLKVLLDEIPVEIGISANQVRTEI